MNPAPEESEEEDVLALWEADADVSDLWEEAGMAAESAAEEEAALDGAGPEEASETEKADPEVVVEVLATEEAEADAAPEEEENQPGEDMASESVSTLTGAREFWETIINAGESGEKISAEAALLAQEEGDRVEAEVDGWFTTDVDEALAFWTGLDASIMDWKIRANERAYFAQIIADQLEHRATSDRIEAEVEYGEQIQDRVEEAAQEVADIAVDVAKDPSPVWAGVGAGLGYVGGKLRSAGIL